MYLVSPVDVSIDLPQSSVASPSVCAVMPADDISPPFDDLAWAREMIRGLADWTFDDLAQAVKDAQAGSTPARVCLLAFLALTAYGSPYDLARFYAGHEGVYASIANDCGLRPRMILPLPEQAT